jgi:hypothetical protein
VAATSTSLGMLVMHVSIGAAAKIGSAAMTAVAAAASDPIAIREPTAGMGGLMPAMTSILLMRSCVSLLIFSRSLGIVYRPLWSTGSTASAYVILSAAARNLSIFSSIVNSFLSFTSVAMEMIKGLGWVGIHGMEGI